MKLINYNYGHYIDFDCSIHGKIVCTRKEWYDALVFLHRGKRRWMPSYPHIDKMLTEDARRGVPTPYGTLYNIRVPATEVIAAKYKLPRYKRANYMFLVTE
jgi:hypothetical protein